MVSSDALVVTTQNFMPPKERNEKWQFMRAPEMLAQFACPFVLVCG